VAVLTTAVVSFFMIAPLYEARAGVMIVKSKSEITLEPKYGTVREEELAGEALEALARSGPGALDVIAKAGTTLEPEEREVSILLEMVQTHTMGEMVVRSSDPKKAAAIANAWGRPMRGMSTGCTVERPN